MRARLWALAALAFAVGASTVSAAPIIVHTSDFIPDATRSAFNGFESIPNDGTHYTGSHFPYVEDGIAVSQVGNPQIWLKCSGINLCFDPSHEGNFSWYPRGGDYGYTKIALADGSDFSSVGFLIGSGWSGNATRTYYELFDNGLSVFSGFVDKPHGNTPTYLGFSGGGFDEIRVHDLLLYIDWPVNTLAIDSIETAVPEPATLALAALGLTALGFTRRRRP